MMKKSVILLIVAALILMSGCSAYNSMVTKDEAVTSAWSQVENQYQRRADLIPNLVATVKGYASHESSTLESVVEARAKATQVTVDPQNLTPEALRQYQEAQGDVTSALGRLMMIQEAYPELKASQNFLELQAQLEGTENRIAVERNRFNEAVRDYNMTIRRFPKNIVAAICGFDSKPYFEAKEGTDSAPAVDFGA